MYDWAPNLSMRESFAGLQSVDWRESSDAWRRWPDAQQAIMRRAMNGTLFNTGKPSKFLEWNLAVRGVAKRTVSCIGIGTRLGEPSCLILLLL